MLQMLHIWYSAYRWIPSISQEYNGPLQRAIHIHKFKRVISIARVFDISDDNGDAPDRARTPYITGEMVQAKWVSRLSAWLSSCHLIRKLRHFSNLIHIAILCIFQFYFQSTCTFSKRKVSYVSRHDVTCLCTKPAKYTNWEKVSVTDWLTLHFTHVNEM